MPNSNQAKKPMPGEIQARRCAVKFKIRSLGFVLIVDDEAVSRTTLRESLEARGYEVAEAENGWQALQKIAVRLPDVILLDLMMPKMDGFEVCRHLKKNPKTAHLPILMITSLPERGDRLLGIQAGANDFLSKPIDLQDVILRLGNAVHAKRLHDQLIAEQEKVGRLLMNSLPTAIVERIKKGETNIADHHKDVTVLVAALNGFATLASRLDPARMVELLNEVFAAFDGLVERHGLENIRTVGDSYMVTGGIFKPHPDHAGACADLALDLRDEMERFNQLNDTSIRLRIGISTGPVVSGLIGRQKFAYDVWGETVNIACRMESTAKVGKIQASESAYHRLKETYELEERQGAGTRPRRDSRTYWLGNRIGSPVVIETNAAVAA